jgi:hypothetical protein
MKIAGWVNKAVGICRAYCFSMEKIGLFLEFIAYP